MNSTLDPTEINRVKVYPVKCLKCKLTVMARAVDRVCPVCGTVLARKQTIKRSLKRGKDQNRGRITSRAK